MVVKTEILNNLESKLKELGIFKKVTRGLVALNDTKKSDFPLCVYNSYKTERNDNLTGYTRQVRKLFIEIDVFDRHNNSPKYFSNLDELESKLVHFIECLLPNELHDNVLKVDLITSEEIINDQYLDGYMMLKVLLTIDYVDNN